MRRLYCAAPSANQIADMVALDQRCLGGMWSANGYQRELDSPNSVLRILSTDSARIIGVGCFWAIVDEAHITLLAIDPTYQGQGLGGWLLWHLLQEARRQQLRHATLEVRVSNAIAQKLYSRFGFQALGQRKRYYPDDEDALILWRTGLQDLAFKAELQRWQTTIQAGIRQHGWQIADQPIPCKPNRKEDEIL